MTTDIEKYTAFLQSKAIKRLGTGFDVPQSELNKTLFPFQKHIVQKALSAGTYAIFSDTGTGKTRMQLAWGEQVALHTEKTVLLLCPLAVGAQTIREADKMGILAVKAPTKGNWIFANIHVANYEQLANLDLLKYGGVILDESSILKNYTGQTKRALIEAFQGWQFKLCCTATPAPNDLNEIGNHAEFLDVMDAHIMRMRWFVRDEGMNNYRLKGHATAEFYGWIAQWATCIRKPSDLGQGFADDGYILPPLHLHEYEVATERRENGKLFNDIAVNATNFHKELRDTIPQRMAKVVEVLRQHPEQNCIIWVAQNEEADYLKKLLPDAVEVRGNESPDAKERKLLDFADNKYQYLITKTKIAQFGMNFQNCAMQVFPSLDFSFEGLYQAVRRSYRFGQTQPVNVHIIKLDTMQNVISAIERKQADFDRLFEEIATNVNNKAYCLKSGYEFREVKTEDYWLMNGDSCELMGRIADDSVDFSVFSPPFSNLFVYSDNVRDLGNCEDHEQFFEQYGYILKELYRILRPGRLIAVHTKDIPVYKNSDGYSGMYDFTGRNHRLIESFGFKFHCKITVWKDPVVEMQRTKTQRLLHKTITSDSTFSGTGMAEYITIFRKWEGNQDEWTPVTNLTKENFPVLTWQKWASPVWMDIQQTNVLNNYRGATDQKDEKHIAPLQLDIIERLVAMWTNKGETVFTPFLGIGSEVYQSVLMGRRGIGIELKPSYFDTAVKNVQAASYNQNNMPTLFDSMEVEAGELEVIDSL